MTHDQLDDVTITDPTEFERALAAVVEAAVEADVDVRGAWDFRTSGSTHDWEVEIVELAVESGEDEEPDDRER